MLKCGRQSGAVTGGCCVGSVCCPVGVIPTGPISEEKLLGVSQQEVGIGVEIVEYRVQITKSVIVTAIGTVEIFV